MGPVITLTTDFGDADGYQGVLEGVIAGINPRARVVTVSHRVTPGDIAGAGYLLKVHHHYFPPGTIHLAVVDPGVGSRRKILAVATQRYFFIAPDNGLLSFLPKRDILSIHSVTNRAYALAAISPVFHGRDIIAPAAAYLSLGVDPACFGRTCGTIRRLPNSRPRRKGERIIGQVIRIDRFGNLITNIEFAPGIEEAEVLVNNQPVGPIRRTFSDVPTGRPVAYIGSGGHLEIAVRDGSARGYFSVQGGESFKIEVALKAARR